MLKYNSETCEITYNGKVVATWNDEAHYDYPEDLIWRRDISGFADKLFKSGIEEGYRIALETLYGDGFDEAGEFLDKVRKKALKGGE